MKSLFSLIQLFRVFVIAFSLSLQSLVFAKSNGVSSTQAAPSSVSSSSVSSNQAADLHQAKGLEGIDDEQIWSILNSLLIGYLTATIYSRCKSLSFDLGLAAAAGVAYISAELMATMQDKELREEIEVNYQNASNSGDKDSQLKALQAQRDGYIRIQQTAENKASLQKTAAAALAVAGGIALYKGYQIYSTGTLCTTEATAESAAFQQCISDVAIIGKINNYLLMPLPSIAKDLEAETACNVMFVSTCPAVSCKTWAGLVKESMTVCSPSNLIIEDFFVNNVLNPLLKNNAYIQKNSTKKERLLFKELVARTFLRGGDLLFPEVHAGFSQVLGLGGALLGVWLAIKTAAAIHIDQWIGSPMTRGVLFEALAASIYGASQYSSEIALEMASNVEDIDRIITKYGNKGRSQIEIQNNIPRVSQSAVANINSVENERNSFPDFNQPTPCLTVQNKKGTCGSLILPEIDKETSEFLGQTGTQFAGDVVNFANDVNGKKNVTGASLDKGASLSAKSAFAIKRLQISKKNVKDLFKKNGQNENFLSEGVRKFNQDFRKSLLKEFKKQNESPKVLVAALGGGSGGLAGVQQVVASLGKAKSGKRTKGKVLSQLNSSNKNVAKTESLKFNFDEEEMKLQQEDLTLSDTPNDSKEREGGIKGGVTEDRSKDIFKILTQRYLETAYPILFDERTQSVFD
jgi:hypothetical protein